MVRYLALAGLAALGLTLAAGAQTTSDPNDTLAGNSAQQNVRQFSTRTPGSWVEAAITRHRELIDERVNARRTGQDTTQNQQTDTSGTTTTSSSNSLLDLVSQLTSGSLGGLDLTSLGSLGNVDLSGLLGLSTGTGTTSTGTTSTGTSTTGSSTSDALAQLLALRDAYNASQGNTATQSSLNTGATTSASDKAGVRQLGNGWTAGGAIARLPKPESRFQTTTTPTTTTEERSFRTRLVEAWAQTFFAAITVAFQSDAFITGLKDAIRPLIHPSSSTSDSNSSDGSNSGDGGTDTSGNGIEDVSPPDGSGDGGDSTI